MRRDAPFVAITGTNGKSTTTALIAHLLRAAGRDAQLGGNIGTAILSLEPPQRRPRARDRVLVLPDRSRAVARSARSASCSTSREDHLDRHGTLAHYAAVKERLVAGVPPDGTAIVGVDDDWCAAAADRIERAGKQVVRVSVRRPLSDGLYVEAAADHAGGGRHARTRSPSSAASARCAACTMRRTPPAPPARRSRSGFRPRRSSRGCASFPGLAHRMEEVGRKGRVLFVNDSKATNADSAAQALACFADIFWIAGGKPKTGGIASLADFFPRIRKAYLIGEAAAEFAATLDGHVPPRGRRHARRARSTLAARDAEASGVAEPVVLLSPACASFDQYPQFRGARRRSSANWCGRCRA